MTTTVGRSRRPLVLGALVAVLVVAAAVITYVVTRPGKQRVEAVPRHPAPTTTTSAAPTPTVSPSPAKPTVPHEAVAAARPVSFTLTGKRFTIKAHVCAMANIRPYDPPGEQRHTVCWVRSGFGVKPSSTQPATSYLFGHAWAEDSLEVLNKESRMATRELLSSHPQTRYGVPVWTLHSLDGYLIKLKTKTGTLTYKVRDGYGVAKNQLAFIKSWLDPSVRGRLMLTTCAELGGVDYDYNIILEAYLYSSVKTRTSV